MEQVTQVCGQTVSFSLSLEAFAKLSEQAARQGQTLEEYLQHDAERKASEDAAKVLAQPVNDQEFDLLLKELGNGLALQPLPADFSRADIYPDHD